jgi:spore germination protein YaaH
MKKLFLLILPLAFIVGMPQAHAAIPYAKFEVSGWIPYWRSATGTQQFLENFSKFQEINPFGYTVKSDGRLADTMKLTEAPWPDMQKLASAARIRFVPTVMWSDGQAIHNVLSNPTLRAAHIQDIVNVVYKNNFDGIDIDYEAKFAETQPYFSQFLKELYKAMGPKWVECDIEARTPADSRANTTPDNPKDYANDYKAVAKYCDRVHIMTYDQASVDRKLVSMATGPYKPVADPVWVEKVIRLAMKDIPKQKITIGVATYGYEYKVTPISGGYDYKFLWAFNPRYATDLAAQLGITPQRTSSGELSFIYRPQNVEPETNVNAASAFTSIAQAAGTALDQSFNLAWWSDAQAIKDKVALAKKLGVRGVSIFKIDGGADPNLFTVLP